MTEGVRQVNNGENCIVVDPPSEAQEGCVEAAGSLLSSGVNSAKYLLVSSLRTTLSAASIPLAGFLLLLVPLFPKVGLNYAPLQRWRCGQGGSAAMVGDEHPQPDNMEARTVSRARRVMEFIIRAIAIEEQREGREEAERSEPPPSGALRARVKAVENLLSCSVLSVEDAVLSGFGIIASAFSILSALCLLVVIPLFPKIGLNYIPLQQRVGIFQSAVEQISAVPSANHELAAARENLIAAIEEAPAIAAQTETIQHLTAAIEEAPAIAAQTETIQHLIAATEGALATQTAAIRNLTKVTTALEKALTTEVKKATAMELCRSATQSALNCVSRAGSALTSCFFSSSQVDDKDELFLDCLPEEDFPLDGEDELFLDCLPEEDFPFRS